MNTTGAIRVASWVVFIGILVLCKGFRIILCGVCHDRRGIQTDKRGVHDTEVIELLYQRRHNRFQISVLRFLQEPVKAPVRWQRAGDVEATVMCDDPVVVQIIPQIGNVSKSLASADDKSVEHGFLRKPSAPCFSTRQFDVQRTKELIVKLS